MRVVLSPGTVMGSAISTLRTMHSGDVGAMDTRQPERDD